MYTLVPGWYFSNLGLIQDLSLGVVTQGSDARFRDGKIVQTVQSLPPPWLALPWMVAKKIFGF